MADRDDVEERERDFWDHHVPTLDECIAQYHKGPDPYVAAMMEAVYPRPGARILDFACGAGITTAWLAARGAQVVGVDLSPVSIRRAEELRSAIGLSHDLRVGGAIGEKLGDGFDSLVGRFALHHLDLSIYAPMLAGVLRAGGIAAFVETMGTNSLLRLARNRVAGRFGVARYGTSDEHPLTRSDLDLLRAAFGSLDVRVPEVTFFNLIDRHVLRWRNQTMTRLLNSADRALARTHRLKFLSYTQVVVLERRPNGPGGTLPERRSSA